MWTEQNVQQAALLSLEDKSMKGRTRRTKMTKSYKVIVFASVCILCIPDPHLSWEVRALPDPVFSGRHQGSSNLLNQDRVLSFLGHLAPSMPPWDIQRSAHTHASSRTKILRRSNACKTVLEHIGMYCKWNMMQCHIKYRIGWSYTSRLECLTRLQEELQAWVAHVRIQHCLGTSRLWTSSLLDSE